jgi:sugar/nucleoside kinase (ribokinase family)
MNKKFDILVVGELNVDLILNDIAGFPAMGKEILADEMALTLGSSSAIFASNISTLGASVAFLGKVGQDQFGDLVLDSLKRKNVNTQYIKRSTTAQTGATIVLNYSEDRAMVTHPGAMNELNMNDIPDSQLCTADHLHVSSIFLQPGLLPDIVNLFAKAKVCGMTTSLDMQWDPEEKWNVDFDKLLPFVDIFLPNEKEIMAITQTDNIDKAVAKLLPFAKNIIVKMGSKGSRAYYGNTSIEAEPFLNTNVVDAIGAGDSFNSGFISQYIKKSNLSDCLNYGNIMGAINTTAAGGTGAFTSLVEVKNTAKTNFNFDI